MNIDTKNNQIPEEVLELLPWFAIGGLSSEEHSYFQEALLKFPKLQQLLDQEREMIRLIAEDSSLLEISSLEPAEQRLKGVLNRIESNIVNEEESLSTTGKIKKMLDSWLPDSLGASQFSSFASVAILVVSLVALAAFIAPLFTQESNFTPASAVVTKATSPASATILLVGFNGSSKELSTYPLFTNILATVEPVSGKKGMYQVSLNKKLDEQQVKGLIAKLVAQKELVWFAGEAF